ncbi:MAG TPA: hypothetical protein VK474_03405, partial [Chthoniobacterales bacterium]|nr:hypothetical protein [Chthoniobacterales bacterium]
PKRFSMRSHVKAIFAVFGIALVAACNDATVVNGDASGTYNLAAINGNPIPLTVVATTTDTVVVTSGVLTINADGTFTETLSADHTTGGVTTSDTNVCPGNYVQRGRAFTFQEPINSDQTCGGTFPVSWDGANSVSALFGTTQLDYIKETID